MGNLSGNCIYKFIKKFIKICNNFGMFVVLFFDVNCYFGVVFCKFNDFFVDIFFVGDL